MSGGDGGRGRVELTRGARQSSLRGVIKEEIGIYAGSIHIGGRRFCDLGRKKYLGERSVEWLPMRCRLGWQKRDSLAVSSTDGLPVVTVETAR